MATGSDRGQLGQQPDAQQRRCRPGRTRCRARRRPGSPDRSGGPATRRRCRRPSRRRTPRRSRPGRRGRPRQAPTPTASDGSDEGDEVGPGAQGAGAEGGDGDGGGGDGGHAVHGRPGRVRQNQPWCRPERHRARGPSRCRADRYPGTDFRPARWAGGPVVDHTGAGGTAAGRRWARPPDASLVRRVAYGAAAGAGLVVRGRLSSPCEPDTASLWAGWSPSSAWCSPLPSRHLRSTVLAVVAGVRGALRRRTSVFLWPVVVRPGLRLGRRGPRRRPWRGWVGGLAGSGGLGRSSPTRAPAVAPFLAVLLGGEPGLLLRSRLRAGELAREAEELRGQAPGSSSAPAWPASCTTSSGTTSPPWW